MSMTKLKGSLQKWGTSFLQTCVKQDRHVLQQGNRKPLSNFLFSYN